ncbi:PD-(D/E)XK nuclease family protein, partial [bacterium]|nr:PD-(D/E)XK nuclease family protein [bacterium]
DRLDIIDEQAKTVCLVDYKTGRARTDNQIAGKVGWADLSERERALPENLRSPLRRQVIFYRLLCELDPDFTYQPVSAQLAFIKSKAGGKPVLREVALTDEDVDGLKELLRTVWDEIQSLAFWERVK